MYRAVHGCVLVSQQVRFGAHVCKPIPTQSNSRYVTGSSLSQCSVHALADVCHHPGTLGRRHQVPCTSLLILYCQVFAIQPKYASEHNLQNKRERSTVKEAGEKRNIPRPWQHHISNKSNSYPKSTHPGNDSMTRTRYLQIPILRYDLNLPCRLFPACNVCGVAVQYGLWSLPENSSDRYSFSRAHALSNLDSSIATVTNPSSIVPCQLPLQGRAKSLPSSAFPQNHQKKYDIHRNDKLSKRSPTGLLTPVEVLQGHPRSPLSTPLYIFQQGYSVC